MLVEAFKPPISSVGFVAEFTLFDENEVECELPPFYEPVVTSSTFKQTCYVVSDKIDAQDNLSNHSRNSSRNRRSKEKKRKAIRTKSESLISVINPTTF